MQDKLTIEEALQCLIDASRCVQIEVISVDKSVGRVLAEDIYAMENIPPFDRSPLDGYAFRAEDTANASESKPVCLRVLETVAAGHVASHQIREGEAIRIMTGAPVPEGADAIEKYECTKFTEDTVWLSKDYETDTNIIHAGEDIRQGTIIFSKGEVLSEAFVGVLAGLGIREVSVYKKPVVAMLNTGSELVDTEDELPPGKIRNSSALMLKGFIESFGSRVQMYGIVADEKICIQDKIKAALAETDCIVTTGGVSVGDYDLVYQSLIEMGADILFWKVQMKPGMACLAAKYQGKMILGLSGNPMAAAMGLLLLGIPMLKYIQGMTVYEWERATVRIKGGLKKMSPTRRLLPGKMLFENGEVWIWPAKMQGNGMLHPLHQCQMIADIEAGTPAISDGVMVKAFVLR